MESPTDTLSTIALNFFSIFTSSSIISDPNSLVIFSQLEIGLFYKIFTVIPLKNIMFVTLNNLTRLQVQSDLLTTYNPAQPLHSKHKKSRKPEKKTY